MGISAAASVLIINHTCVAGSARARIVVARSQAETPVVTPDCGPPSTVTQDSQDFVTSTDVA